MVNCIKKIRIENIKGKGNLELEFTNLTANQPNIVVAQNGYGKSTIAKAFKLATKGKINMKKQDFFENNKDNHPKLEIELVGEKSGTYSATNFKNEISKNITIHTISTPIFAKSTSRQINGLNTSSADLRVEEIIFYEKVPEKIDLGYSFREIKKIFIENKGLFIDITNILNDYENIIMLSENITLIKKCLQKREQNQLKKFLECIEIRNRKHYMETENNFNDIDFSDSIKSLSDVISTLNNVPDDWNRLDAICTVIQICFFISKNGESNAMKILKKHFEFLKYQIAKKTIDERLSLFDTTNFNYKTQVRDGKLILKFMRAEAMSNGERDILSFIANITKFKLQFKHKVGILIIDEVFDYLDGSNMLAVQYYLSELIEECKRNNKILYPIIFTHLDPNLFGNYYFNKKKIHYISMYHKMDIDNLIVKILRLRESKEKGQNIKNEIERFYLHYTAENHITSSDLNSNLSPFSIDTSDSFRGLLYDEVKNKYLKNLQYNPIMVALGIRIRIEEIACLKLSKENTSKFLEVHTTTKKLNFVEELGNKIPELYYLLQPLYNDGVHLKGSDENVINKVKASYLKTNNKVIQNLVSKIFIDF